jgi:hypothetical protein
MKALVLRRLKPTGMLGPLRYNLIDGMPHPAPIIDYCMNRSMALTGPWHDALRL